MAFKLAERTLNFYQTFFDYLNNYSNSYLDLNKFEYSNLNYIILFKLAEGTADHFKRSKKTKQLNRNNWLGGQDSNLRMAGPKPAALPLGDRPLSTHN